MSIEQFSKRLFLAVMVGVSTISLSASNKKNVESSKHIKSVSTIAEVFGNGQKVSAVVVEYDAPIDSKKLKVSDYSVEKNTVTKVYANTEAAKSDKGMNGKYVIVELSTEVGKSDEINHFGGNGEPPHRLDPAKMASGPVLGSKPEWPNNPQPMTAGITQVGTVYTVDGSTYLSDNKMKTSTHTTALVVDDFKQFIFTDPTHNNKTLRYNLYIPKNLVSGKKYPLVLFVHDAGCLSENPLYTLVQGNGATSFASPSAQAKNACFVLAPQYTTVMTDDNSETTEDMDITVDLLKDLQKKYSIDTNRIYNTGQSMGGMASIAMDIKYPEVIAASLLVACQWDVNKVAASSMAKMPLWIVVSQGDTKAFPGMTAITKKLESQGATIAKAMWNAEADFSVLQRNVEEMETKGCSVNFTIFKDGDHGYTWKHAYSIDGLRDWLFKQVKK